MTKNNSNLIRLWRTVILALGVLISLTSNSQDWSHIWQSDVATFEEKRQAFYEHFRGKDLSQTKGWKQFKRYEYYYERLVGVSQDFTQSKQRLLEYFKANNSAAATSRINALGNWSFIGPSQTPTSGGGAGRVTSVEFIPGTSDYFVGAPNGGLWKRTGTAWTTNTDFLSYLGFSDIEINPNNANEIYAATGDGDAGDSRCIGVLKSTNGGTTWTSIGLTTVSRIYKIMAFPGDFNRLIAATSSGIFLTTNGGTTWTTSLTGVGTVYDMEFKPGTPSTIFAVNAAGFYISTNSGASFNNFNAGAGLPGSGVVRRAIAVTAANPEYIYLVCGRSDNYGLHSFWRSTNGGATFTKMLDGLTSGINLLGWSNTGMDVTAGGQAYYDLSIAASPTNANIVFTGGVNIWKTMDGGASWVINGHWTGSGAPYVHADIHNLDFNNTTGDLYASTDGGLFRQTNVSGTPNWTDLSNGLQIGQMYKLGASQTNDGLVITGWQDNGTNLRHSATNNWQRVIGGDGMECAIDPTNANIMLGEIYYGRISKTSNGGTNWSIIVNSGGPTGTVHENGDWVTPYGIAKSNPNVYYVGKYNVYRSNNGGTSWVAANGIPATAPLWNLTIAPSNENYVYTSRGSALYVSTDGANFVSSTSGLPSLNISGITVHGTDPNIAWVTMGGFTSGQKVYKTTNAGQTWTNVSGDLPNTAVICIVVDAERAHNQLYIGTETGVYYKNDTLANWLEFDNELPNTTVAELEIVYSSQKIKAATYGRGAWESPLFTSAGASGGCASITPVADFSAAITDVCPGQQVTFNNNSTTCQSTYSWSFPGATPSTSTDANPVITYSAAGTYDVVLTVTSPGGTNTKTMTNHILVRPNVVPTVTIASNNTNVCSGDPVSFTLTSTNSGTNPNIIWFRNGVVLTSLNNQVAVSIPNLANGDIISAQLGSTARCALPVNVVSNSVTVTVRQRPAKPVITQVVGDLHSSWLSGNQWFFNTLTINGATSYIYHPVKDGSYTVQATENGCTGPVSDPFKLKIEGVNKLYPVPSANGQITFDFYVGEGVTKTEVNIFNSLGQLVHVESTQVVPGLNRVNYNWNRLAAGVYYVRAYAGKTVYVKRLIIQ